MCPPSPSLLPTCSCLDCASNHCLLHRPAPQKHGGCFRSPLSRSTFIMSSRPMTPASGAYGPSSTHPDDSVSARPDFTGSRQASHVSHMSSGPAGTSGFDHSQGPPHEESALSEAAHGHDNEQPFESAPQESPTTPEINRSASRMSQTPSMTRSGTLKKKSSLKRPGSIVRSASKRSSYAGSVRSLKLGEGEKPEEPNNSAFYCPVPTSGNPTELLAARFQGEMVISNCARVR